MRIHTLHKTLVLAPLLLLLTACANNAPRSLYYWGDFPAASYAWLKDDVRDGQEMLTLLEKDAQTAVANAHDLPPGFHAHLGLLYLKLGQTGKAVEHLQAEKAAFPESAPFMDFQLRALSGETDAQERDAQQGETK